jgi:tetrathionate reductase subunit B
MSGRAEAVDGTPVPGLGRRALALSRRHFLALIAAVAPGLLTIGITWPRSAPASSPPSIPASPTGSGSDADTAAARSWAFGVNAAACIGCGRCVEACKLENNVPLDPEYNRTWVERRAVGADGTVFVDAPDGGIHGFPARSTAPGAAEATIVETVFLPRLCMQCENPPCVAVCPVSATYRTPEGIVLVDQTRCIGCGYCVVACPYGARYIVPAGDRSPTGQVGVADKCTWCYHRISRGENPACVEVCPVGARVFGDLSDPDSPIQSIVNAPDVDLLRADLGTRPRVFYAGVPKDAVA